MRNLLPVVVLLVIGFAVYSQWQNRNAAAVNAPRIVEKLRTQTPVGPYTKYFERRQYVHRSRSATRVATYFWRAPQKPWPEGLKFPLVVALHGAPGTAYAAPYLLSGDMQIDFPAFILVPMSPPGRRWSFPVKTTSFSAWVEEYVQNDHALTVVVGMIGDLSAKYPVDTDRIYIIGCSEGGEGAFGAARHFPDVFAAAVPISGGWSAWDAENLTKIPLLVMHGARDTVVPVSRSRDTVQAIRKLGGVAEYAEFPSMGHECPSPSLYSKKIWAWLFSQKKSSKSPG